MTRYLIPILAFCTILTACRQTLPQNKEIIHPNWTTLTLPNGWTIQAPTNFKIKLTRGVDSEPGYIYSSIDSLTLGFDSGIEFSFPDSCDFGKLLDAAKKKVEMPYYKELYKIPDQNTVHLDTIDNKIAKIITSNVKGMGLTNISISDCGSGAWIGIHGYNLSPDKEKLVLEMYSTLTRAGNNAH